MNSVIRSCVSSCVALRLAAGAPTGCTRPCTVNLQFLCCDGIWIPNVDLPTAVAFSQDRWVSG